LGKREGKRGKLGESQGEEGVWGKGKKGRNHVFATYEGEEGQQQEETKVPCRKRKTVRGGQFVSLGKILQRGGEERDLNQGETNISSEGGRKASEPKEWLDLGRKRVQRGIRFWIKKKGKHGT